MNLPCILLGGGGHGRVLLEALLLEGATVLGITDVQSLPTGSVPYLGSDDAVHRYRAEDVVLVNGVGSVGDTSRRRAIFERFHGMGYAFRCVVHPSAVLSPTATLGQGVQIMAGAIIQSGTTLGDNTIVNTGAIVDHDCQISAHVHIAPRAVLSGGVVVGTGAHVGTGASVRQGIVIGEGAVVGLGAAVVRAVRVRQTVIGVPALERSR